MKINNIFYSVQGEGENIGVPAIFIRFTGCNKRCSFCDTVYAFRDGKEMTVDEVVSAVINYKCQHIVITGGEPLLQQEEIIKLITKLLRKSSSYYFEIETNGTIAPIKHLVELIDLFTVSPKFEEFEYSNTFSCKELKKVVFKFVVDKKEDIKDILQFNEQYNYLGRKVILMPCSVTVEEHGARLRMIIDLAKKYGFWVTPRIHILAYGNKRGV